MKLQSNESKIAKFYSRYPFPNIPLNKKADIYQTLIYKLIYGLSKKYLDKYGDKKIKILDAGCGTGELALGLSNNRRDILAVDNNKKSILIARGRAQKFNFKRTKFKNFDLIKENLPKNYFDFIYSIGVLHHLPDPEQIFSKLVKSLQVGGYIVIGIYNPFGSFRVRLKRGLLHLFTGNNFERKIEIYRTLFYRRPLTLAEKIAVADAFANPYRKYFTFHRLLMWFEKNNIEYLDSAPPIELSKNIELIKTILKNAIKGKQLNLMSSWQEVTSRDIPIKKWQISKPMSLLAQLSWLPIGRGELINLVGRKLK